MKVISFLTGIFWISALLCGQGYRVDTLIGLGNRVGDGGAAVEALLRSPGGLALDSQGRLLIADRAHHRVRRVELDGSIITIAGTGDRGVRGDDGPARDADLWEPSALAVEADGSILVADGSARIRRITVGGRITTMAGNGRNGFSGDGGKATLASIGIPGGIAVDSSGAVYFSEPLQARIRRISPDGMITTIAGTGEGGFSGDGGPAAQARLQVPFGLAITPAGVLLIADFGNLRIRAVNANGTISTIAGGGEAPDGSPASAAFLGNPCSISVDQKQNLYIGEFGDRVRRVDAAGIITTIASSQPPQAQQQNPVFLAPNSNPCGLLVGGEGRLYVSQSGVNKVELLKLNSIPWSSEVIAGRGAIRFEELNEKELPLFAPQGLDLVPQNGLLVVDSESQRIFKLKDGKISIFAGNGAAGFSGDGLEATKASLTAPTSVVSNASGITWIADSLNRRIRRVDADGKITTVASALAVNASNRIEVPLELALDPQNNVYFTELGRHTVRVLDTAGNIRIFAGSSEPGFSGDGEPAIAGRLNSPVGLSHDSNGNLYVADSGNLAVRKIDSKGIITTIAGRGSVEISPVAALEAKLLNPSRVAADREGNVFIAESPGEGLAGQIRKVDSQGNLHLIAGNGSSDPTGEGGLAQAAGIGRIGGLRATADGSIWFTDIVNRTVRKLTLLRASTLRIIGGDKQQALIQTGFKEPLAVQILNEDGIPIPGVIVKFRVESGAAELGQEQAITDVRGIALASLKSGSSAGEILVIAETDDLQALRFQLSAIPELQSDQGLPGDYTIRTVAGAGTAAQDSSLYLRDPGGFAFDGAGNLYLSDSAENRIVKLNANGDCEVLAGTATGAFCKARPGPVLVVTNPAGMVFTPEGDLLFVERSANRVRRLSPSGEVTLFAGSSLPGFSGDNGPAVEARLNQPFGLLLTPFGDVLISDSGNRRIRKVDRNGQITTFAGSGESGSGGSGFPALKAPFVNPAGMTLATDGILYIADSGAHEVKGITPEGIVFVLAGTGRPPGILQEASATLSSELNTPISVAASPEGVLYIGEQSRIRVLPKDQLPYAIADRDLGTKLLLGSDQGRIFVLDADRATLRRMEAEDKLITIAGGRFYGDGSSAFNASLSSPEGLAWDLEGNLLISDTQNHRIRRINREGIIETIAGTGIAQSSGDGGPALSAGFDSPAGIAVDKEGAIYVAELRGARIRRIDKAGIITTYAGSGLLGNTGDGGFARQARFQSPSGLVFDSKGNLYVSDVLANVVRRIGLDGQITRFAGTGRLIQNSTEVSIGLRATETDLQGPAGLAVDAAGNLLIADRLNNRIWSVTESGAIVAIAGNGQRRAGNDGILATDSPLNRPSGIAVGSQGQIYISESANRIRKILPAGLIYTVAGRGPAGDSGDESDAIQARLNDPGPMVVSNSGDLVFSDRGNRRIRRLSK